MIIYYRSYFKTMIIKYKNKRNCKTRVLVFIVIMAMFITMFPMSASAQDGEDISQYVSIDGWNLSAGSTVIIDNGQIINTRTLEIGESVTLSYDWSISEENSIYVEPESYFVIDIESTDFNFSQLGSVDILDQDNTVIAVLTAVVEDGTTKLVVTFTDEGAGKLYYENGWIEASGYVAPASSSAQTISINGVSIPVAERTESTFSWSREGFSALFSKGSSYDPDENEVTYIMHINTDNYRNLFEDDDDFTDLTDVRIEDYLPTGTRVQASSINVTGYYYLAMGSEVAENALAADPVQMSSSTFSNGYSIRNQFTIISEDDPAVSYEEFKQAIDDATDPTIGIYQSKAIYINAGDLRGDLEYNVTWGELKSRIDNASISVDDGTGREFNAASDDIKQKTKEAYARVYGVPEESINTTEYDSSRGQVTGFILQFTLSITGEDRDILNEANLFSGDAQIASDDTQISFYYAGAGVNTGNPGDARLTKLDGETGEPIEGAKFKLMKMDYTTNTYEDIPDGTRGSGIYETDENGEILIENLNYGKYKVVETEPAEGYSLPADFTDGSDVFEISADDLGEKTIEAYNYSGDLASSGIITIIKYDKDNPDKALEGAEFQLIDSNEVVYGTATTDSEGEAVFEDIPWGTYSLKETVAPEGYNKESFEIMDGDTLVSGESISMTVGKDIQNYNYTAYNESMYVNGSVEITKYDSISTTTALENSIFTLYIWNNEDEVWEVYESGLKTDEDGKIRVDNLPEGRYKLEETDPPPGYREGAVIYDGQGDETNEFVIERGSSEAYMNVYNEKITGNVKITKIDRNDDSNLLEGTVFSLKFEGEPYEVDGELVIATADAMGVAEFSELPWGEYEIIEESAARGYDASTITFEGDGEGKFTINEEIQVIDNITAYNVSLSVDDNASSGIGLDSNPSDLNDSVLGEESSQGTFISNDISGTSGKTSDSMNLLLFLCLLELALIIMLIAVKRRTGRQN